MNLSVCELHRLCCCQEVTSHNEDIATITTTNGYNSPERCQMSQGDQTKQ